MTEAPGECARFDALLAARADGALDPGGAGLLERHLAGCEDCRRVAESASPAADAGGDHASLPRVDPASYALGLEVARGGMGRVLAARDLRIGRPVAVKELLGGSPQLAARFEREARVTARLQHPGIVPIYEIGAWPDGTPFYAMRMVDGRTLGDAIAAATSLAARLALLPAVIAAAEAVAFAHAQRVIHRDLTPSNILAGAYGETVVIDWGLAKDLSGGEPDDDADDAAGDPARGARVGRAIAGEASLTGVGAVIGTAPYMPPEQAHARPVDERADVYALGAILYHVLAGVAPYTERTTAELLRAVKAGPPRPVDELVPAAPRDLVSIVGKAMARDPGDRYRSARELAAELTRFAAGRMVEAHTYSPGERVRRFVRRHRAAVIATALAATILAVVATTAVQRVLRSRAEARATARGLLLEKGRVELLAGNTQGALVYLHAAAGGGRPEAMTRALSFLAGRALRGARAGALLDCGGYVVSVAVSPDGASLAAACSDHAKIWRLGDRALVATLGPFRNGFYHLRFTRDGATLATWGGDGTARLWDARTGAPRGSFRHGAEITMTSFSPDGARLATTGHDGFARIWDVATAAEVRAIAAGLPFEHIYGMLSPDGRRVLTMTFFGAGAGWDARTGERLGGFDHGSAVIGGDLSADGELAISCGIDRLAKVWNARTGAHVITLAGHTDVIWKCLFDPTGARALTTGHDGRAIVWDLATGATIASIAHGDILVSASMSPDGHRFVTIGVDGRAKAWDARSGALLASIDARRGKDARFLPDGRGLIVLRGDGRIELWDDSSSQVAAFSPPPQASLRGASRDGLRAITAAGDALAIRDTARGTELRAAPLRAPFAIAARAPRLAARTQGGDGVAVVELASGRTLATLPIAGALHLDLSADAARLGVVTAGSGAEVWDVAGRRRIARLGAATAVHLSSDGRAALVQAEGEGAVVWHDGGDPPASPPARVPIGARGRASPVGFSEDGSRVAVTEDAGGPAVGVWDTRTGDRVLQAPAVSATIDPGGSYLTAIGPDHRVTVWRLADGEERSSFEAEQVISAQIDAGGALIAAIGEYGTAALVLDAADGRVLARWPIEHDAPAVTQHGFRPPGAAAWWTPDGTRLVTRARGITAWHAEGADPATLDAIMRHVPWRLVGGRLVQLRDRTLRGRVVRGGAPVAGVTVSVEVRIAPDVGAGEITRDNVRTRYVDRTATTDGEGVFALPGLSPGAYVVAVKADPPRTFEVFVSADPADRTVHPLELSPR